ncbi:MAG: glycosyltransferase [Candidatus Aquicultorales bacterium]
MKRTRNVLSVVKSILKSTNIGAKRKGDKLVIHHLGKAGEGLLALPMASTLRQAYPNAHIAWVVLDRYRAFLGQNIFVDSITEVDSSRAMSLKDIGDLITSYHTKTISYEPYTKVGGERHYNAYCNYIVETDKQGNQRPLEIPFYKQFFKNLALNNHEWFAPVWMARESDIDDGEQFLKAHGIRDDQKIVFVSPFVADKTIPVEQAQMTSSDWNVVAQTISQIGFPIVFTGTEFDEKLVPTGCIDGYGPKLSLGGLLYLIQTRSHLVVCGNTGIGFAALFLKSNLLMYDNRTTWTQHTHGYRNNRLHRQGDSWPMFDTSTMADDLPDWESSWIQKRWDSESADADISTFREDVQPALEVFSHKSYRDEDYALARKLLALRGHKYIRLPSGKPACRISVLVSLYSSKKYVIPRIANLLEQTEQDTEIIVIDAHSPQEDGQAVLENYGDDPRITVIKLNQRVPLYSAWNIGLCFSKGKYVINANADDLLNPTALKTMANWMDKNPSIDLLAGSWFEIRGDYNRWPPSPENDISTNRAPGHFPMWRRKLHSELGLLDDSFKIVGDIEWWTRLLLSKKKIAKSSRPMGAYLDHGDNLFIKGKNRRLQEINAAGWPHFHKVLYKETLDVELAEVSLPGYKAPLRKEGPDLSKFRDKHLGQRCFIMGNGPSLNQMDLTKLNDEIVFASNACYLLFDRVAWRPKYYASVDSRFIPDRAEEVLKMHEENPQIALFMPSKLHIHDGTGRVEPITKYMPPGDNRYFFNHTNLLENNLPWSAFSIDINNHVVMPHTVTITLMQLAFYMGFKDIYLIGCDTSYKVPDSVIQEGPVYDKYGKLLLTSTKDDDINHFDPSYFGAGKRWHNPKVGEMIRHYGWAKRVINACGGQVINATVGGDLEVFPRVSFDSLFSEKVLKLD